MAGGPVLSAVFCLFMGPLAGDWLTDVHSKSLRCRRKRGAHTTCIYIYIYTHTYTRHPRRKFHIHNTSMVMPDKSSCPNQIFKKDDASAATGFVWAFGPGKICLEKLFVSLSLICFWLTERIEILYWNASFKILCTS